MNADQQTTSTMMTFLRRRLGGQQQMADAISEHRARVNYQGPSGDFMGAVKALYDAEIEKDVE